MGKVSTYTHFARIFIYLSSVTELNTDSLCWDLMKKKKKMWFHTEMSFIIPYLSQAEAAILL